ncbi:MAG: hypothetical protein CR980_00050 [Propionibacteriales bacterium]|nr:MAG: hypothetical protein CR980_00050 [Propionibacteriales bacterium]
MTGVAITMMLIMIITVFGGLTAAVVNLIRHPEKPVE